MKSILVRCDDASVGNPQQLIGLLDVAKLAAVHQLAQAGTVGVVTAERGRESQTPSVGVGLAAHWGWLGYAIPSAQPDYLALDAAWAPARAYAATLQLDVAESQVAWCCDFVTHHDGRVIDPTAGHLPTKEASSLVNSLNAHLATPRQRWVVGEGWRHALLVDAPEWVDQLAGLPVEPPERMVGQPWPRHLPRGPLGDWMRRLIDQAADVLDHHEINRVRVDLGENPANLIWLWGSGTGHAPVPLPTRHGVSGAMISSVFPLRGLARLLGVTWSQGVERLEERPIARLLHDITRLIETHDVVYVPIRIEETDPTARQCAMERVDQGLVKPLAEEATRRGNLRLVVAVDDRPSGTTPFAAIGPSLATHPALRLTAEAAMESPMVFETWEKWRIWWFTGAS